MNPVNKCRTCGSTSYKSVIARDEHGAMRASGVYQCTGCRLLFTQLDEWRGSPSKEDMGPRMTTLMRSFGDLPASRI